MRLAASVIVAALFVGCSGSTDPATAAYWVDRLDDKTQRGKALKEIGKIGDASAAPAVLDWFQQDGDWQPEAAFTLGRLGDKSVVPALIQGLDYQVGAGRDKVTTRKNRTNANIARALAELKAPEGVEPLVNLLKTQELKTREAVINSLGKIGDKGATASLVDIATNESQPFIRKKAIQALGEIGDPAAVPTLIKNLYIEMSGTSFYYETRYALIQVGKPGIPKLIETLKGKNTEVAEIRLPSGDSVDPVAVEAKASFVLGALQATEAEDLMIATLSKHYKSYANAGGPVFAGILGAVVEECYALEMFGSKKAIPVLQQIAVDTHPRIRMSATEALTAIGAKAAVPTILKAARTGDAEARNHAIKAASRLGSAGDLAALEALTKSADKAVPAARLKKMIEASIGRLQAAKECKEDLGCWKGKLEDEAPVVRERAVYQLGWQSAPDAIPALLKAAEDDDVDVRKAAISSLASIGDGIDVNQLQTIHDRWKEKITYKDANANLRRLIARMQSTKNGG